MTSAEFEHMAAAFRRETHWHAPGKDVAPGFYSDANDRERRAVWSAWLKSRSAQEARDRFRDDLRDAHAEYLNEASGLTDDEARAEMEDDR